MKFDENSLTKSQPQELTKDDDDDNDDELDLLKQKVQEVSTREQEMT